MASLHRASGDSVSNQETSGRCIPFTRSDSLLPEHGKGETMSAPITLQQFTERYGKFKFLKLALLLRAPEPAFRHVLITLADHADGKTGVAYPGYDRLKFETGYTSDQTIASALQYWKKAGILSWRKGWGNAHSSKSNVYQFHDGAIWHMLGTQSGMILETPLSHSRNSTEPGLETPLSPMKSQSVEANDSVVKRLSKSKGGSTLEIDSPEPQKTGTAHAEEISMSGVSYESPVSGLSSTYVIPSFTEFDRADKKWYARRDIGRGLTADEVAEMQRLNTDHVRP
jgi:hypothetical protein